jgi:hypothetical protein
VARDFSRARYIREASNPYARRWTSLSAKGKKGVSMGRGNEEKRKIRPI